MSCCCRALGGRAQRRPSVNTRNPPSSSTRRAGGTATCPKLHAIAAVDCRTADHASEGVTMIPRHWLLLSPPDVTLPQRGVQNETASKIVGQ
jgi:hypothetical protein